MALNLKTLSTRAISALFFVLILVGAIYWSYLSFLLLFFAISMVALHEYYRLAAKLQAAPYRVLGFAAAVLLFLYLASPALAAYFNIQHGFEAWYAVLLLLFIPALLMRALFSQSSSNLADAMHTLMGIVYAVLPLALLATIPLTISGEETLEGIKWSLFYNYFKVLGILFLIWANDTLAYLGGSLAGKHKMYERISPGKTWEGTIIGALGAIGVGFLLNLNHTYESNFVWPVIGLLVAMFGTTGDLVESMLKRQAGVKDSGQIMPGHGGALDRFDSLIFVSPFIYVFFKLLGLL